MKSKFFLLLVPFGMLLLSSFTPATTFTQQMYNTGVCSKTDANGNTTWGSQCNNPNPDGPCTRQTECKYE
ncbi:hypothetical protein [Mucilaginibacter pankratovii]|uniref:hypothetical protein n=1 Tax=Mucilaginibacter pankratovii TaxID=2772110 RepID=UPI001745CFD8|nr:hypothetical protein [Mucilaginibacter pankratovii]